MISILKSANCLRLLSVILLASLAFGCAPLKPQPDAANPLKRVAVLPMQNDTDDVDAPSFVREKLVEHLRYKQYNVRPVEEVDQLLRDRMGITLGGQLEMAKTEQLKNLLGVEGLVFGTLMDYNEMTTGLYNARKVRAKFRIVNAVTGETFWERGLGVKSETSGGGLLGSATALAAGISDSKDDEGAPWVTIQSESSDKGFLENLATGLAQKAVAKAIGLHLVYETNEMIRRVTLDLPNGPGFAAGDSYALPITMPEISMPEPPSFDYVDYGKRDFSAVLVSTTVDKSNNRTTRFEIPLAKAGGKHRMDIDISKMTGSESVPAPMSRMITIYRGDKKLSYMLYPNRNKYIVQREGDEAPGDEPVVEKTRVGSETIDGHPTDKFKVRVTYRLERVQEGFIWNAKDLDGMTIKSEVEDKGFRVTTVFKNIVLKTPPADMFEIPAGYTEAKGFMELME